MGLVKAITGATGGVLADQWKEFIYCDALPADVLMTKGRKKTTSRSSNTKGDENVISNGSVIAVAPGQCMIISEQGKVVDICAEPGEYVYDSSTEPSIFSGDLGTNVKEVFKNILRDNFAEEEVIFLGNSKKQLASHISVSFPGIDAERMVFALETQGVLVATGSACAANKGVRSHTLTAMGLTDDEADGSLRISLGKLSNEENTKRAAEIISKTINSISCIKFHLLKFE